VNTSQTRKTRQTRHGGAALLTTVIVLALGAVPAAAKQDPGPAETFVEQIFCAIERVGTQYTACDNLTGNGVPAPAWVDER
jgi:hypothetical protein